jgi:hypothetical protein
MRRHLSSFVLATFLTLLVISVLWLTDTTETVAAG